VSDHAALLRRRQRGLPAGWRRGVALLALALLGCSGPPAPSGPSDAASAVAALATPTMAPLRTLRVGYTSTSASLAPVWFAADAGFFASEGLDVDLGYVQSGPTAAAALQNGDLAVLVSGAAAIVSAQVEGADLQIFAAFADQLTIYLYAAPVIRTAADLRGAAVGVTRLGSNTDTYARAVLERAGLDASRDATLLATGASFENVLLALTSGLVAAGVLAPPFTLAAREAGFRELAGPSAFGAFASGVSVAPSSFLDRQPDTVLRYLRASAAAIGWAAREPERAEAIIGKYTRVDDPSALRETLALYLPTWDPSLRPSYAGLAAVLAEVGAVNPRARELNPASLVDLGPTEALAASRVAPSPR
jgi:NitT/TauT family transport system substrate-binding protein